MKQKARAALIFIMKFLSLFAALLASLPFCGACFGAPQAQRVYILANEDVADSVKIAQDYASQRGVPAQNIITLKLGALQEISREFYDSAVAAPLLKTFIARGAVKYPDPANTQIAALSCDVDFLVLCRGVPHKINSKDPSLAQKDVKTMSAKTDAASVDSELSMLFMGAYKLEGPSKNPLYKIEDEEARKLSSVLKIARLDAVTPKAAFQITARAVEAEKTGLMGRAYIDKAKRTGGDAWLDGCIKLLDILGYDTTVNEAPSLMGPLERLDGLAIYFGWYNHSITANFLGRDFKFAEGAFGWHIYSFSAENLRADYQWTAGFAQRGMSASCGYAFEPYLPFVNHCDKFLYALMKGMTAGEAAYFSAPALSWQGVFVGDPLYNPFKYPLENQLAAIERGEYTERNAYAVIRKMNLIAKSAGDDAAINFGRAYLAKFKGAPLPWKICELLSKKGEPEAGLTLIKPLLKNPNPPLEEVGLYIEMARFAYGRGESAVALNAFDKVYETHKSQLIIGFKRMVLPCFIGLGEKSANTEFVKKYADELKAATEEFERLLAEQKKRTEAKK